jgi:uncharacterized protein YyaL (SSP411 family)
MSTNNVVLVHGGFSDYRSNRKFVLPFFEKQFISNA